MSDPFAAPPRKVADGPDAMVAAMCEYLGWLDEAEMDEDGARLQLTVGKRTLSVIMTTGGRTQ